MLIALCDGSHMFMMIPPSADLTGLLPFASLLILRANEQQGSCCFQALPSSCVCDVNVLLH